MFDTMRSAVCFAVSLPLLRLCYTSNLYLNAVPVDFTGFILSHVSFFHFNSYSRHVHARHFRCVITVGIAQMCVPAGMLVP